jgi:hypothetical protein
MRNQIPKSLMQGIKELHIKILQSNDLPEVGNYLQEILDRVLQISPVPHEKSEKKFWKDFHKSDIIHVMKSDINAILDGTYRRIEIAKYKATMDIAWLKKFFADPLAQ